MLEYNHTSAHRGELSVRIVGFESPRAELSFFLILVKTVNLTVVMILRFVLRFDCFLIKNLFINFVFH